jgi:hypothetical protein
VPLASIGACKAGRGMDHWYCNMAILRVARYVHVYVLEYHGTYVVHMYATMVHVYVHVYWLGSPSLSHPPTPPLPESPHAQYCISVGPGGVVSLRDRLANERTGVPRAHLVVRLTCGRRGRLHNRSPEHHRSRREPHRGRSCFASKGTLTVLFVLQAALQRGTQNVWTLSCRACRSFFLADPPFPTF